MDLNLNHKLFADDNARGRFVMRRGKKVFRASLYHMAVDEWACQNVPCPRCARKSLAQRTKPPVYWRDLTNFECKSCGRAFLLLATSRSMRGSAQCPSYRALVNSVEEGDAPDIICITYDREGYKIDDAFVVRGSALDSEFIVRGGPQEPSEDHDTWCNIHVGRMVHKLGKGAVAEVL